MYFGVNFILQKFCMCKKNDKYEVCKKLCNDIVNPTDLWSSISLISETGSLKVTLSGRVPGNIYIYIFFLQPIPGNIIRFWINSSNQLWPQRTDLSGPKESFCNQEEIYKQIGFIGLLLTFFQQPNKNRWPPLPWLSICQRTFLSNNFIPLLLKNFSRKGEVWRELSLNVLIQFGGERKGVQSIFNHQTLWNNMLDDFPSWKIQISHF